MDDSAHSRVSEWDELEARSLMSAVKNGAQDTLPKPDSTFRWRQMQVIILLAMCALVTIFKEDIMGFLIIEKEAEVNGTSGGSTKSKNKKVQDIQKLRTLFAAGKKEFRDEAKKDYGKYTDQVFNSASVMTYFASPNDLYQETYKIDVNPSRERLKRRIMIKIIESQLNGGDSNTTFTWAVGGHSAAAGHGNLFHQAYGNIIEKYLKGPFRTMGIEFRSKNYAMGGTKSGPEVSMCMESIFGRDVDVLSWDYGMTDGRAPGLYNLWAQRAGAHPTRPILFSFGQKYAREVHNLFAKNGGAGFETNFTDVRNMFPNSDDPDVDVETLPRAVKNYLCNNGHVETGEPCGTTDIKYDTASTCPNIKGHASWHNGWKDHLFIGRLAAAFILEYIDEALVELSRTTEKESVDGENSVIPSSKPSISLAYLNELKMHEEKDKETFLASEVPKNVFHDHAEFDKSEFDFLQRSTRICRAALLPSQARYDGLFGTNEAASYLFGGKTDYVDEGSDINNLPEAEKDNNSTELPLVYNHLKNRNGCKEGRIDFKDIFYVRAEDHWVTTKIPNDKEEVYFYASDFTAEMPGAIMACTLVFDWENYPADYVKISEMVNNTVNNTVTSIGGIVVNNVKADGSIQITKNCHLLTHGQGEENYFFAPDGDGRFDIKFRVPRAGGNLYLTSIVAFNKN